LTLRSVVSSVRDLYCPAVWFQVFATCTAARYGLKAAQSALVLDLWSNHVNGFGTVDPSIKGA
jgi:hypothetical protein